MSQNKGYNFRRGGASELGAINGWQIVYTGFILIMLSFFILLTSFASLDPSKITRFVDSFSNAVNVLEQGKQLDAGNIILESDMSVFPKENLIGELFEKIRQVSVDQGLDDVLLQHTSKGVVMTLKDSLLFDSGKSEFSSSAYGRLEKIGRLIQTVNVPVEIEGYSDSLPIRNQRFESNWELSTARAVNVLRYLIEKQHIDPNKLSAVGYGEFHPIAENTSPEGRAANRRVNFVFNVDQN